MTDPGVSHLELLPRRAGDPLPEFDQHYRIRAELGWLLKGPAEDIALAASTLTGVCERISDDFLLLSFGNAVGFFDIPGLGRIEVVSGKWSRADFETMLHELTEIAAGLPFAATSAAALPYDRTVAIQEDILYHMFVYLRHALSHAQTGGDGLQLALHQVLRDPHRRFERTRREVPVEFARHLDFAALAAIATGKGGFTHFPSNRVARGMLVPALRNHVPNRVDEPHIISTVDTAENRFVKTFLGSVSGVIDRMRRTAVGTESSAFAKRIAAECDSLDAQLRPIVRHPLWREVGPMVHLPASSPVLQRRRGYREIYRHFVKMRLAARIPLDPALVHDLLEAKDIAQLYEIWCYFAVVRELANIMGAPIRAGSPRTSSLQVTIPWDLECVWADGTQLLYNPRFSRSSKKQQSFSVPLRPDIALNVDHGENAGLHLLDAKFKLESLGEVMPMSDETDSTATSDTEEREGTFKLGDLYKMHAYRDAIVAARSVWILYPGTETRFFSEDGSTASTYVLLPYSLVGVGAVPLRPSTNLHVALRSVLLRLLGHDLNTSVTGTLAGVANSLGR